MMSTEDLMYKIAVRVHELANMTMPVLRMAADYEGLDIGDRSRGAIIEAVIIEEFDDAAKTVDEKEW